MELLRSQARQLAKLYDVGHMPGRIVVGIAGPACGGDIRLIALITDPAPIRKLLTHRGEPLEPPPLEPARGPPTSWDDLVQVHDDRDAMQTSPDDLPLIDIRGL